MTEPEEVIAGEREEPGLDDVLPKAPGQPTAQKGLGGSGDTGVERLIEKRTRTQIRHYKEQLPAAGASLGRRIAALARLRTREGYMASAEKTGPREWLLVENHCPICAAARTCQGPLFRKTLGPGVRVERVEHVLFGARRCVYRIRASET